MTTRKKLGIAFGTLTALLVVLGAILFGQVRAIHANVQRQVDVSRPRAAAVREMEIHVLGFALDVRLFIHSGDLVFREEAAQEAAQVETFLAEYERVASDETQRVMAARFSASWREYRQYATALMDASNDQPPGEDMNRLDAHRVALEKHLREQMKPGAVAAFSTRLAETSQALDRAGVLTLFMIVGGVLLAVGISVLASRAVLRGETALRESEEQMRRFIESAPTGVAIFDCEMRYLAASRRWLEAHHATGSLIGRSHYEVFPDLPEQWKVVHRRGLAGEIITADEDRFDRADGTTQWMKWEVRPWHTGTGETGGIMIAADEVTERKQAKDALQAAGERLHLVTDGAPALISYIDADYRYQSVNKLWAEWFARSADKVVGRTMREVLHEEAWRFVHPLAALALSGETVTFERELRCRDKGLRWLQVAYAPDRGDDGRIRGFVAHATDITARKASELALQQAHDKLQVSEARFRALFESAPVGIAQGDVATLKFDSANQRYCDIVGHSREELDSRNFKEFTHPDDLQADLDNMKRLLAGEVRQYTMEKRYLRRDGCIVWGSLTIAALWAPGEKPGSYMAVVADITGRKETEAALRGSEERLRLAHDELEQRVAARTAELLTTNWKLTNEITERAQAQAALRRSEERFRQVTEAIDQVFWMTSADKNQMLYVSPGYERIWGRSCQSLYDSPRMWLETVHPDDHERVLNATLAKQATGEYDLEYRILRPDGEARWIHDRAFPIRDEAGQVHRIAGLADDITERKRLREEIEAVSERERERLGRDLHDGLSQLLVGARLKTDSLVKKLAEQSPENVPRAEGIAALMARAVEESNNLARGLDPVEQVPEGLMSALTRLADTTDRLFGKDCACDFPSPVVLQDHRVATELFRIAQEAVNNAVKHGEAGTIRIRLADEPGHLVLTVTNDGKPFPKRPKTAGMGLKTMAFRADRIGATLQISPGPDGGTIVRCALANSPAQKTADGGRKPEAVLRSPSSVLRPSSTTQETP